MANLNTGHWGISSSTYTIPKPYGEIFSWKLYRRDKLAPTNNACAYKYFSETQILQSNNLPTVRLETDFSDDGLYFLETYNSNSDKEGTVFVLKLQEDRLITQFQEGDWIKLDSAVAYTVGFMKHLPLVQIHSIYIFENCRILRLCKPVLPIFEDALLQFLKDNQSDPDNNAFKCSKVSCFINSQEEWGWTGDARDSYVKNNNADKDEWMFQIVCIDSQNARDATSNGGFSMIASTQWASMHAVKSALENTATGMVEKMSVQYNKDLSSRFWSFYADVQNSLNVRAKNTFGPLDHNVNGNFDGGYILLRSTRSRPHTDDGYAENVDRTKRPRIKIGASFQDHSNQFSEVKNMIAENVANDVLDNEFELIAGSIVCENTNVIVPPPEIGVISDSDTSLFKTTVSKNAIGIPTQSYRYRLQQDVKFRIQNSAKGSDVQETLADLQSFDKPSMPFEHDLHSGSSEKFVQEFQTFSRLLLQCLVATTKTKSFRESASEFTPIKVSNLTNINIIENLPSDVKPRVFQNPDPKIQIDTYTIDVTTGEKRKKLAALINEHDPWTHPDDNEFGACSKLLWQPCVEIATGTRTDPMDSKSVENMITTITPFGNIGSSQNEFVDKITKKIMESFSAKFKTERFLLKQADDLTYVPEYEPITLQYDILCDEFKGGGCSWS